MLVAALDVIEPLSQEADHPLRADTLPVRSAELFRRHLAAPALVLAALLLLGAVAAAVVSGDPVALEVGAVVAVPSALVIACCAAFSATNDPFAHLDNPQIGYIVQGAPVGGAVFALALPLLVARAAWLNGNAALSGALPVEIFFLGIGAVLVLVLGERMAARQAVRV